MGFNFNRNQNKHRAKKIISARPAKRNVAKWQWYMMVIILVFPVVYVGAKFAYSWALPTAAGYVYFDTAKVYAPKEGVITLTPDLHVGDKVYRGESLGNIDNTTINTEIELIKAQLAKLAVQKARYIEHNQQWFEQAQATTQAHIVEMSDFTDRHQALHKRGIIDQVLLQRAQTMLFDAEIQDLQLRREHINDYQTNVRMFQDEISRLNLRLATLQAINAHWMDIASPVNGVVTRVDVVDSQFVNEKQPLFEISTQDNMLILTYLPPDRGYRVNVGDKVIVEFPSGFKASAEVYSLPLSAVSNPYPMHFFDTNKQNLLIPLKITAKLPDDVKVYGLPVRVRF